MAVLNSRNSRNSRIVPSSSAPAGRRVQIKSDRKERSVFSAPVSSSVSDRGSSSVMKRLHKVVAWSNTRKAPLLNFVVIVLFLLITLSVSLLLRTQMAEISFEQSATQSRIVRLRQDVETTQAQLDTLEAGLPAKAQEMGMVPQQNSISIDLSDYAKNKSASGNQQQAQQPQPQQQQQQKPQPQQKPQQPQQQQQKQQTRPNNSVKQEKH